jgi:hypothetical protein
MGGKEEARDHLELKRMKVLAFFVLHPSDKTIEFVIGQ